jgi:hypothetical protein
MISAQEQRTSLKLRSIPMQPRLMRLPMAYTATGEVVASGYTAGGEILVINQVPTTGNPPNTTAYLSFANASWTGAFTARGALIYKDNGTTNPAVCVLDFGADKTSASTFVVQFPAATDTTAIIRIA